MGICLPEEETWGKGYGTEAVCLLVDHLFDELELQEIRTATWTGNKRMMRCAEKSTSRKRQGCPIAPSFLSAANPWKGSNSRSPARIGQLEMMAVVKLALDG